MQALRASGEAIMPFKSVKQRNLLAWKHPEIYKKWKKKYGKKIGGRKKKK